MRTHSSRDCDHKKPGKPLTHTEESVETTQIQVLEEAGCSVSCMHVQDRDFILLPSSFRPPLLLCLEHAAQRRTKSQRTLFGRVSFPAPYYNTGEEPESPVKSVFSSFTCEHIYRLCFKEKEKKLCRHTVHFFIKN